MAAYQSLPAIVARIEPPGLYRAKRNVHATCNAVKKRVADSYSLK
jgi:hypothetical protein